MDVTGCPSFGLGRLAAPSTVSLSMVRGTQPHPLYNFLYCGAGLSQLVN